MTTGTTQFFRYAGRRQRSRGGLLHLYLAAPYGVGAQELAFAKPLGGRVVGGVVGLQRNGDGWRLDRDAAAGSVLTLDADVLAEWRSADRAAETADRARLLQQRLERESGDLSDLTLAQVRDNLRNMPGQQRAAYLALVLRVMGAA